MAAFPEFDEVVRLGPEICKADARDPFQEPMST